MQGAVILSEEVRREERRAGTGQDAAAGGATRQQVKSGPAESRRAAQYNTLKFKQYIYIYI